MNWETYNVEFEYAGRKAKSKGFKTKRGAENRLAELRATTGVTNARVVMRIVAGYRPTPNWTA